MNNNEVAKRLRFLAESELPIDKAHLLDLANDLDPVRPAIGAILKFRLTPDKPWSVGISHAGGIVPSDNLSVCWSWHQPDLEYEILIDGA